MPHPILIGGLVVGGAVAAWRIVKRERRRLRKIVDNLSLMSREKDYDRPIPLERDPVTGIYRPAESRDRSGA